ncbi:MAG: D-glucuronyl C5-epimerase family protein [Candidatus Thermoplasmatota archaeon]|jgi:hypothetical protein
MAVTFRALWEQAFARGYYATPQPMGSQFRPGELAGYFNDLRLRAAWPGPVDELGLPAPSPDDPAASAPVTALAQFGLGHWDLWLEAGRPEDHPSLAKVLAVADRICDRMDDQGRWVALPNGSPSYPGCGPYSALTQGEGISLLARAHSAGGGARHYQSMRKAAQFLVTPVEDGGVCRRSPDGFVLEEVVTEREVGILNGWIFALFGLYDLGLADPGHPGGRALEPSLAALATNLSRYDRGYWSNYDLVGAIAKPNYHLLHISQFTALEQTFPAHAVAFGGVRRAFQSYQQHRLNRFRAVAVKAFQVGMRRRPAAR